MPESDTSRLDQLRERWESDPTSRVFVQLAEEHRRRGEPEQALEVLESGLAHHPAYLSARVALARCQLDLGLPEPALTHLREVLAKDPTHLVAGKLVVETHLALGARDAAQEALARYRLLGAPEEEVEELEAQFRREPAPTPEAGRSGAAAEESPASGAGAASPEVSSEDVRDDVLFRLPAEAPPAIGWPASNGDDGRHLEGALESAPFRIEPGVGTHEPDASVLWPSLLSGAEPEPPSDAELSPPAVEAPAEGIAPTVSEPAPAPPSTSLADEAAAEDLFGAPESAPETSGGTAPPRSSTSSRTTATLGDLYLRQGHLEEAESIYRGILERDPTHAGARRGLETLTLRSSAWLGADDLLPAGEPRPAGLTATKRKLLERYLKRLKEGAGRDVPGSTS